MFHSKCLGKAGAGGNLSHDFRNGDRGNRATTGSRNFTNETGSSNFSKGLGINSSLPLMVPR
jgi:hypothetical protein